MLDYTVNQRPHWACQQCGHSGGTRGWLGGEMSTLHAGYIPQRKVTSVSSNGSLGFIMNLLSIWRNTYMNRIVSQIITQKSMLNRRDELLETCICTPTETLSYIVI